MIKQKKSKKVLPLVLSIFAALAVFTGFLYWIYDRKY